MNCYNEILHRTHIKKDIISKLQNFEETKNAKDMKRAFYITGENGVGKTEFVKRILKELDYDILHYYSSDIRNKAVIENMTKDNMSNINVASMFKKKKRRIAIIMDEIDGMNSGDKGGISSLITLIRPKKTRKQLTEHISNNPIFCISTNEIDKKTKELQKVCHHYEFKKPTYQQLTKIVDESFTEVSDETKSSIVEYSQYDFKKINSLYQIYLKDESLLRALLNDNVLMKKTIIEISKDIVKTIFTNNISINSHNIYINENDRTIVALLWHENICDVLNKKNKKDNILFYKKILDNLCYGDFVDRITFQKQIWQFNELSSYIKIMYNNYLLHNEFKDIDVKHSQEIRFTKVLTKYSTEFNNYSFFQNLSYNLMIDKRDIISYFNYINNDNEELKYLNNNYDIKDLDIQRIYRYINNHSYI
jgi:DNA polymerase III delta prime subunit